MSTNSSQPETPGKPTSTLSTEERRTIAPDLVLESGVVWEKYKLPIMAGVTLVVLGLVGTEFYQNNLARSATAASTLLDSAKTDAEYQRVIDTYPGSEAAANAYLLLGRAKFNAQDFSGAAQTWQAFVAKFPRHSLVPTALTGVAGAQEAQGKLDEARSTYQRIATGYPGNYAAPLARLGEADILLAQRKTDDAKHIFEDLMALPQKGIPGQIAERSLKTVNALPVAGGSATPAPAAAASSPSPTATPAATVPVPVTAVPATTPALEASPGTAAPTPPVAEASPVASPVATP